MTLAEDLRFLLMQYTNLATWNWRLMKTIMTVCHVYDKEENYIPFDRLAPEESQPITFLKKAMPNYAAWFMAGSLCISIFFKLTMIFTSLYAFQAIKLFQRFSTLYLINLSKKKRELAVRLQFYDHFLSLNKSVYREIQIFFIYSPEYWYLCYSLTNLQT